MNLSFIITFIVTVLILYVILKILALPIKLIIKLIINAVVGGLTIFVVNAIGATFGFALTLNWITALTAGILGIPGVIILVILHVIF